jgi:DnaJ family protein B protein 4
MPNHYEILGVSNDANETDIKKAYRALSLKYHPDRNPSEEAITKIQQINEAYEILGDQAKRNQYDMELSGGGGGIPGFGMGGMPFAHMNSMNEFNDINHIFNMMFGGGGMHGGGPNIRVFHGGGPGINIHTQMFHQINKPEPIIKQIQITIEQSFTGCNVALEIERFNIENNVKSIEKETVYLNIPQGIDNNETILLSEKGHCINGQIRGEVRIQVQLINNSEFKRQGTDLIYNKKISLKEALCGFVFEVNHLNGKRLALNNVNNPTVIKPNFKKLVPGMGMTRENSTGNLIIEFEVDFPDSLTAEQISKLNEIL